MQQHATIADVFSAAAGAASPFLRKRTEELKEQNDRELRVFANNYAVEFENKLRDTQYDGDPVAYKNALMEFKTGQYAKARGENTSAYSTRMLDEMERTAQIQLESKALEAEDEYNWKQEDVSFNNAMKAYKASGYRPDQIINAIKERIDLSKGRRPINPKQSHELLQLHLTDYYQQYMARSLKEIKDPDELKEKWEKIKKEFDDFAPKTAADMLDEEGKVTGTDAESKKWTFDGKDEWDKKALEQEDFGRFYEAEAYFQRLLANGKTDQAVQFVKEGNWGEKWDRRYTAEFDDYSGELLARGRDFFNTGELEAARRRGGNAGTVFEVSRNWREAWNAVMNGNYYTQDGFPVSADNMADMFDEVISIRHQLFYDANVEAYGKTMTGEMWREEYHEQINQFLKDMRDYLKDTPEFKSLLTVYDKFTDAQTYINNKSQYYNKDFQDDSGQRAISFFVNLFLRQGVKDPAALEAAMKEYTGKELLGLAEKAVRLGEGTASEEAGVYKRQAELDEILAGKKGDDLAHLRFMPEKNGVTGRGAEPDVIYRDKRLQAVVEAHAQWEAGIVAAKLGVDVNSLGMNWAPSEKRKGDIQPKRIFFIKDEEGKTTHYKVAYNKDKNPLVQKYNPEAEKAEEKWQQEGDAVKMPLSSNERYEYAAEFEKNMRDNLRKIEAGLNPLTGEKAEFDHVREPPPGTYRANTRRGQESIQEWRESEWNMQKRQAWFDYYLRQARNGGE